MVAVSIQAGGHAGGALADDRRGRQRVVLNRATQHIERGGLVQYGHLEIAKRSARTNSDLLEEPASCRLKRLKGLRLAPAPVEGHDQLLPKPLPQRVEDGELAQFAHY